MDILTLCDITLALNIKATQLMYLLPTRNTWAPSGSALAFFRRLELLFYVLLCWVDKPN